MRHNPALRHEGGCPLCGCDPCMCDEDAREEAQEMGRHRRGGHPKFYWTGPYHTDDGRTYYAKWERGWDEVLEVRFVEREDKGNGLPASNQD